MDETIGRLDATAQAELVARGEVSAVELLQAAIARAEGAKQAAILSAEGER